MTKDLEWEAEDYFPESRKERRNERKIASRKDRSKFKKTDQKQLRKQAEQNPQLDADDYLRGRVLEQTSQGWQVECEDEMYACVLRGVLKKDRGLSKNLVTVGDWVLFEALPDQEGVIVHVEERSSVLSRADNLSRRREQLIASNIDQVLVTTSVVSPPLKPALIDRYIIAARKGNMEPVIIINKIDLLSPEHTDIDHNYRLAQQALLDEVLEIYPAMGYKVVTVSADAHEHIVELEGIMRGKASVFSGQSGVGKTSLINVLTGRDLRVGDVVEKTRKGAHTTTSPKLLSLECGGWCVDTPGIKSFGLWDLSREELEVHFKEIHETGQQCKFPNCSHHQEPDCAVHAAVERGEISALRFESYLTLAEGIGQKHLRR
ncbi:MAG: ribosome small subunit-dependent GTPase A [Chlamydiia bacterium]|nr:ribosome small subunit-dependent GTPase A [Chlamydiia bacterium]